MATITDRRSRADGVRVPLGLGGARPEGSGATAVPPRVGAGAGQGSRRAFVSGGRRRWAGFRRRHLREDNEQATWSSGSRLGSRVVSVALLGAIACGPVGVVMASVARPASAPAPVASFDDRMASRRSVAAETAVQWAGAWLTTPADRAGELRAFYGGQVVLPKTAAAVANLRVVDAVPSDAGVWTVTVGGEVTPAGAKAAVQRYFQVPVAVSGGGAEGPVAASPMSTPAPVAGPRPVEGLPGSAYGARITSGPVVETVQAFLTASLTGQDVSRFVTPGSAAAGATTTTNRWGGVEVVEVGADRTVNDQEVPPDGTPVRVLASVLVTETGADSRFERLQADIPLTLTTRGGRWEVSSVDQALATTQSADPAPTNSPS